MEEERSITPLPKSLPFAAVILLVLGLIAIPMVQNVFTEQQLAKNALLNGIPFILIFASIVLFFMSFIWFLSNKLNFRVSNRTYKILEYIIIGGIIVGIVMMFQPWVFDFFRYGFYLLLFSTLCFMAWSHVTPAAHEDIIAAEVPTES